MNNNRLTSITLLSELYNHGRKDVFYVVGEFIKAAIVNEGMRDFDSVKMKNTLKELFNIDLPEAVIRTVLNKRLSEHIERDRKGGYLATIENQASSDFKEKEDGLNKEYESVFNALYDFMSKIQTRSILESERDSIKDEFIRFLLDEQQANDDYQILFNAFIVTNQHEEIIMSRLNTIKNGLIIYSGIQYSAPEELTQLGSWKEPMTIYLDTEHLFNLTGLNGELAQRVFLDFYDMVKEINVSNPKVGRLIEFRFFEETKIIVDNFFKNAEYVIEGKSTLDPSKTALLSILEGCREGSDVLGKKSKFYADLQSMGVHLDETSVSAGMWNLSSGELLDKISKDVKLKGLQSTDDEIYRYLDFFSRLNAMRLGNNNVEFDKCRYLMLSGNRVAHHISRYIAEAKAAPFSTYLDFITSRMWFRLKKSFANGQAPKAFDIIARSQIVLSSQVCDSIGKKYEQLKRENRSKEELQALYNELRLNTMTPSQITHDTLPDVIDFIQSSSDIEDLRREKSHEKQKNAESEKKYKDLEAEREADRLKLERAEKDLAHKNRQIRASALRPHRRLIIRRSNMRFAIMFWLFPIMTLGVLCWGTYHLLSPNDTVFGISTGAIGIGAFIWPSFKKARNKVGKSHRRRTREKYAKIVKEVTRD